MKNIYTLVLFTILFSKFAVAQYITGTVTSVANAPTTGTGWTISSPSSPFVYFNSINYSKDLYTTGYFLNIPLTSTITGIEVNYKYTASISTPGTLIDSVARMLKNGTLVGDNKASTTPDYTVVAAGTNVKMGGPGDLWGTTWVPTDVYNSNFGFGLKVNALKANVNLQIVNGFSITIFYTSVTGIQESQTSSPSIYSYENQIYFPNIESFQNASIEVFDMLGNKVFEKSIDETIQQVNLSHLTKGLYVYKFHFGQKIISQKIYIN